MRHDRLGPQIRTIDAWGWCHERQACSAVKFNGGLVLNRARLARDVALQEKLIKNIRDDLAWVESWRETAVLDADGARTRFDVIQLMRKRADDIRAKIKAEEKVLKDLNGTQCTLLRRCQLFINTSSITIRGVYEIDGELLIQPGGEEIAVFSFDQIDLGPEVNVTVVGQRPLILASRSTARFQTPFVVAPGTLGGFPGGYSVGSDPADVLRDDPRDVPLGDPQILDGTIASTNANGPGAPSVRVHLRSVRTEASDVDEIQRVTLAGDAGENLGGFWRLTYRDFRSRSLPPDASADLVRRACEEDLNRAHAVHRSTGLDNRVEDHAPGVGRCAVAKRRGVMGDDAAQWTLTFTSQIGAMELLGVEDHLTGMGANIRIERLQGGNSLGGTFALKFRGTATRPLAHDATSLAVARALVEDLPHVVAASATRSDGDRVGGECDDGLCEDGPRPGGGLEWTLTLVTLDDVITPRAPVGYDWKGAPRGPLDGDVYDETPTAAPTYDTLAPSYDTSVPSLKPTGEWLEPEGPCPNLTAAGALTARKKKRGDSQEPLDDAEAYGDALFDEDTGDGSLETLHGAYAAALEAAGRRADDARDRFARWRRHDLLWASTVSEVAQAVDDAYPAPAPGDAGAVLQAFEYFGKKYPMYSIGATKGKILDSAVAKAKPRRIVEVGSFLGYSAVRMAAKLPGDGTLACVEGNAEFARTAQGVVARAGLSDRVRFFVGLAADEIPGVAKELGRADLVFLDHCKECYAPDLRRLEGAGLVAKGTVVVADNVVYPGAPGYLDAVAAPDYATVLRDAPYESKGWETKWKEVPDAMSVSTRLR